MLIQVPCVLCYIFRLVLSTLDGSYLAHQSCKIFIYCSNIASINPMKVDPLIECSETFMTGFVSKSKPNITNLVQIASGLYKAKLCRNQIDMFFFREVLTFFLYFHYHFYF